MLSFYEGVEDGVLKMEESELEVLNSRSRSRSFCVPTPQPWPHHMLLGKGKFFLPPRR
jgi:hypothetical protein